MLFNVINRLIDDGDIDGLEEKVDIFFLAKKLTKEEYNSIIERLHPVERESTVVDE